MFSILVVVFSALVLVNNAGCGCLASEAIITYDPGAGDISSPSETARVGSSVILPMPTRSTYAFTGWYTAPIEGIRVGGAGDNFAVKVDVTLYAQWTSGVTIYYYANEGSMSQLSETVLVGSSVMLPEPTRTGYTFYGWYNRQGEKVGVAGDIHTADGGTVFQHGLIEILRAEWRLNVTVLFSVGSGGAPIVSITTPAESSITLPAPTRKGYTFSGWYTTLTGGTKAGNAGDSYVIPLNAVATTTLYARWIPGEVTLTYDANGGSISPQYETTLAETSVTLPAPNRNGYVFDGWHTAPSGGTRVGGAGDSFVVKADVTLYAQWASGVTVTYDANGGSISPQYETTLAETSVTLPAPNRNGYVFDGWHTAPSGGTRVGGAGDSFVVEVDVTLYAHWRAGVTVTYNANGGNVSPQYETTLAETSVTLPAPNRNGYVFDGWHTAPSGGTRVGGAGDSFMVEVDVTLYAWWSPGEVTLTYNPNGGIVSLPHETVLAESCVTLPAPFRNGYFFNGWYTAPSGGTRVGGAGDIFVVEADVMLYAQWRMGVSVFYNPNGGNVSLPYETVFADGSVTLPESTRDARTFNGWYTAPSGGTRVGGAGDTFMVDTDVVLYAQWEYLGSE